MATNSPVRLVIDPNVIGSVLIGGVSRNRFVRLLNHIDQFDICYCDKLLTEIRHFEEVAYFKKKGITAEVLEEFIETFQQYALKINATSNVKIGRDSNDYFLLSLCRDSRAAYLITGDPDLLTLRQYATTEIVSLKVFSDLFW